MDKQERAEGAVRRSARVAASHSWNGFFVGQSAPRRVVEDLLVKMTG
jgi:hypothetical protein